MHGQRFCRLRPFRLPLCLPHGRRACVQFCRCKLRASRLILILQTFPSMAESFSDTLSTLHMPSTSGNQAFRNYLLIETSGIASNVGDMTSFLAAFSTADDRSRHCCPELRRPTDTCHSWSAELQACCLPNALGCASGGLVSDSWDGLVTVVSRASGGGIMGLSGHSDRHSGSHEHSQGALPLQILGGSVRYDT